VLAVLLGACATDPAPETPTEPPAEAVPMTFEDSAAALRADIDSLRRAMGQTQAEVDAGFQENDSMRQALDALGEDIEATRQRAEDAAAETDALVGQ